MATYNVELRQRVSGTFGDTIYLKANWNNLDNKPSTFTPTAHAHGNVTNDGKIGTTAGLIIKTGTAGLLEALAAGNSGQFLGHDGTWKDLPAIVEESFNTNTVLAHDLTYVSAGDFKTNIKNIDEDKLIFVQFPTTSSTSTLRVSVNNGTTYYNVVKNGNTMRASVVSGQLVRLQFDGTKFVADIQGDVEIVEEYSDAIESTFGQFNPHDGGVPIVREVQGRTIPALDNLVTNGDFSDGTTGWTKTNITISGGKLVYNSTTTGYIAQTAGLNFILDNVYYVTFNLNLISRVSGDFGLRVGNVGNYQFVTSTTLGNQVVKGSFKRTGNTETFHLFGAINTGNGNAEFDNLHIFNLTTLYGVKATSGTAYDNAVADIEAMLALNGGYISTTSTTHLEDSEFKSVGKNLFDKGAVTVDKYVSNSNGTLITDIPSNASEYIPLVSGLTRIVASGYTDNNYGPNALYDENFNFISGRTTYTLLNALTIPSNARYLRVTVNDADLNTFQLEQGTVATPYTPYTSETQKFNHGALRSTIDKTVRDKIRYDNGQYVLDVYVDSADNTALATPLLATEVIDVDGTLIQESTTTVEQLQNIPTTYDIEFSMNTEQTTKTLVHRDKIQQQEIDNLEDRATTLEARKTVSHNVIYMSATAWSTYTRVDGEVYGVWNESTGIITMYYGTVGA